MKTFSSVRPSDRPTDTTDTTAFCVLSTICCYCLLSGTTPTRRGRSYRCTAQFLFRLRLRRDSPNELIEIAVALLFSTTRETTSSIQWQKASPFHRHYILHLALERHHWLAGLRVQPLTDSQLKWI